MLVFFQPKKKTSGRDLGGWNSEYGIVNVMSVYTNTQTHISTKITGESYIICPSFGCGSTSLRHIHHSQVGSEAFPLKKKVLNPTQSSNRSLTLPYRHQSPYCQRAIGVSNYRNETHRTFRFHATILRRWLDP